MAAKTIDGSGAGMGDSVVALWIAEGARAVDEEIRFVEGHYSEVVRAFGYETTSGRSEDCMVVGSGSNTYEEELSSSSFDTSPRTLRWQRTVGWDFRPSKPNLRPLPEDALGWADAMADGRPLVVIAPKANIDSRSMPMQKWLRVAWSLADAGIRTLAIDGSKEVVESFPFYAFGFGWSHILALLSRAAVVAANDSGIAHLASTIGTHTVAAIGPTNPNIVFGHCLDVLTPIRSSTAGCTGCHFAGEKGYQVACDHGCEALQTIPWQIVKEGILNAIG